MRAGANRSGDALDVDIAEIFLCQSSRQQIIAQLFQLSASQHSDSTVLGIHRLDTLHVIERNQHIVGLHKRDERMAAANHSHMTTIARIRGNALSEFVDAAGHHYLPWITLHRARPVMPAPTWHRTHHILLSKVLQLYKTLTITPIGIHLINDVSFRYKQQLCEAFA